jgi:hypothetical protein
MDGIWRESGSKVPGSVSKAFDLKSREIVGSKNKFSMFHRPLLTQVTENSRYETWGDDLELFDLVATKPSRNSKFQKACTET